MKTANRETVKKLLNQIDEIRNAVDLIIADEDSGEITDEVDEMLTNLGRVWDKLDDAYFLLNEAKEG